MYPITHHPILDIPEREVTTFEYKGQQVKAAKGYTIAAALHQAGFPIHSHSLKGRERSMDCGIGKCGACEMLVDGVVKRICVTLVDGVKKVEEIAHNHLPEATGECNCAAPKVYKTEVAQRPHRRTVHHADPPVLLLREGAEIRRHARFRHR